MNNYCIRCKSDRILSIDCSFADCCNYSINGNQRDGYIKDSIKIGNDDSLHFSYCLHCGVIQNQWPAEKLDIEKDKTICDTCGGSLLDDIEFIGTNKYCRLCGAIQDE